MSATACADVTLSPIALAQTVTAPSATETAVPIDTPAPADTTAPALQPGATPANPGLAPGRAQPAGNALASLLRGMGLQGGVVTSNSGTQLGLKLANSTEQLDVAPSAIVAVPGKTSAAVSDISVGDRLIADVAGSGSTRQATMLLDLPADYTASNVIIGAVQSNTDGTLALRARTGTRDVTASASTMVVDLGAGKPTLGSTNNLAAGNAVVVIGTGNTGAFDAQVIVVLDRNVRNLLRRANPGNRAAPTPGA
ncbi:MAG: hypothetical protein M1482_11695 [Chloroflexi bacterium]|nr:hypothetical protein [Chloroflexota bacterium]